MPLDGTLPARLPDSLAKYYDDMLRRRGIGDLDTLKTPLIVMIAWAIAPLDPETRLELLHRWRALPRDRAKAERNDHPSKPSFWMRLWTNMLTSFSTVCFSDAAFGMFLTNGWVIGRTPLHKREAPTRSRPT